jgi:hypothetical protein
VRCKWKFDTPIPLSLLTFSYVRSVDTKVVEMLNLITTMQHDRAKLSQRFIDAVRLSPVRAYVLARVCSTNPVQLSQWLNRARDPRANDPRVIAIGRILGLRPEDCFESTDSASAPLAGCDSAEGANAR